jgi:hypothetical protein
MPPGRFQNEIPGKMVSGKQVEGLPARKRVALGAGKTGIRVYPDQSRDGKIMGGAVSIKYALLLRETTNVGGIDPALDRAKSSLADIPAIPPHRFGRIEKSDAEDFARRKSLPVSKMEKPAKGGAKSRAVVT